MTKGKEKMIELLKVLISSGVIIFFYIEIKKCLYKRTKHDLKIYRKFNAILNDNQIVTIIKDTQEGYLPEHTYGRVDALVEFIQLPKNKFLDKKINKLLLDLIYDLHQIAQLYSMCGRCELIGNKYKLVAHKDGNPEEFELINNSTKYSKELLNSYRVFRLKIKKKFKL
ncbi:TPA: hypothetical protein JA976_06625 [Legionella pneumophila]|nr:hypothetical protein [Legionella pneumophila]HCC3243964.1 hypothetical protein [Legionella pneumophila subsp. pneumophila]HAT8576067.1 hypothetical protein [Legionella pneumophila]HAU2216459.1 hypothetical protein [Legionella pneumophila]HBD7081581.1 hypothetical protein [Legionella pneumophila]